MRSLENVCYNKGFLSSHRISEEGDKSIYYGIIRPIYVPHETSKSDVTLNHINSRIRDPYKLGKYLSLNNHPKAKGVNLKLQIPDGWEIAEGNRPNVVKKFTYENITYMILIKELETFISRKETVALLESDDFIQKYTSEFKNMYNEIYYLKYNKTSIDRYPALEIRLSGKVIRGKYELMINMKNWIIFYEDRIIYLQGSAINYDDFNSIELVFDCITNSVIFPEQYE